MIIRKIPASKQQAKIRVAVYCRVSTKRAEQEDSLAVQQETYLRYIRVNPEWEFAGIYTDTRSGLCAEKREGFMQLIEDCKAGKIDLVLCKSVSRFSRNIIECQRYTEMLRAKNVTVIFEKERIRTDQPTSNLIFSLMCAIAQDESRSISENIKTAHKHRVEMGVYTAAKNSILGYDAVNGKYVPNKDAWIVRRVFEMYAGGASIAEILRDLEAKNAGRLRSSKPFSVSVIRGILKNEKFVGDVWLQKQAPVDYLTKRPDPTVEYTSNFITDAHEGIVSREVWNRVQDRLKAEEEARKEGIHLSGNGSELYGRIICSKCGSPYVRGTIYKRHSKNGEKEKVWRCRGRVKPAKGCKCTNRTVKEADIIEIIRGLKMDEKIIV